MASKINKLKKNDLSVDILIKNKKLLFNNYKVKCSTGKRGIGRKKREGDQITPKGKFKVKYKPYKSSLIFRALI